MHEARHHLVRSELGSTSLGVSKKMAPSHPSLRQPLQSLGNLSLYPPGPYLEKARQHTGGPGRCLRSLIGMLHLPRYSQPGQIRLGFSQKWAGRSSGTLRNVWELRRDYEGPYEGFCRGSSESLSPCGVASRSCSIKYSQTCAVKACMYSRVDALM